jgi:peptidyl-tRNA hydrolase, PTH1 family
MALFIKRTNVGMNMPLYSTNLSQTKLVVGLGNPGDQYACTRHNIGFDSVDQFVTSHEFDGWKHDKKHDADIAIGQIDETRVILVKPQTFMNNSGQAVQSIAHYYTVQTGNILVLHDELDIPFGVIKTKHGGGSAGHNGLKSIITHLGEEFSRVRIGIANDFSGKADSADFVLGKFTTEEQESVPLLIREASAIIEEWLAGDSHIPTDTRTVIFKDLG